MKVREKCKNCPRLETKDLRQLCATCNSELDPLSIKDIIGTISKTLIESEDYMVKMSQCNFLKLMHVFWICGICPWL